MSNNPKKNAKTMVRIKDSFEQLSKTINSLEMQVDDELKSSITTSTNLIQFNNFVKQINLLMQIILESDIENGDISLIIKTVTMIDSSIFELRNLLMKNIQKSMLNAVDSLAKAESGLILVNEVENMYKILQSIIRTITREGGEECLRKS